MDNITLIINGYENYKGRADVTHNSWFRLSNRFLEDSEFFDFSSDEKLAWIYILSIASQKNSATISLNLKHADKVCSLSPKIVKAAIEKLNNIKVISLDVTSTLRERDSDVLLTPIASALHNKQTNKQNITLDYDFEESYNLYPRKEGKKKGIEKLKREIKTEEKCNQFKQACVNYAKHCVAQKTELRFIKHFSSFVTEWEDWIKPSVVSLNPKPASSKQKDEHFRDLVEAEKNSSSPPPELKALLGKLKGMS